MGPLRQPDSVSLQEFRVIAIINDESVQGMPEAPLRTTLQRGHVGKARDISVERSEHPEVRVHNGA
ncbi:MAG: hypothetical protein ACPG1A_02345 [Halioglobus sp.]